MITKDEYLKALEVIKAYNEQLEYCVKQKQKGFVNDFILTDKPISVRYINSLRCGFGKENIYMSDIVERTYRDIDSGLYNWKSHSIRNTLLRFRNFGMKGLTEVSPYIEEFEKNNNIKFE